MPLILAALGGMAMTAMYAGGWLRPQFQFPKYEIKDPKGVTMLTLSDDQRKKLPKYARAAIERLEATLAEANVAHGQAVEKGTQEIRRLEKVLAESRASESRLRSGDVGEIRIWRGVYLQAKKGFYARMRPPAELSITGRPIEVHGKSPEDALSKLLRSFGRLALDFVPKPAAPQVSSTDPESGKPQ